MAHGPKCSTCGGFKACDGVCPKCERVRWAKRIQDLQETQWPIGDPFTYHALEESYSRLKFGQLEPAIGRVSQKTFTQIGDRFHETRNGPNTLKFNRACVFVDDGIPDGHVVWQLPSPIQV